jgi:outer membrane protein assembly factor BamD (BamD/ComL family)
VSGNETEAALGRAEELLERLKTTREELERLAAAENAEAAVEVLTELAELAKQVEVELAKARANADRPSQPDASS